MSEENVDVVLSRFAGSTPTSRSTTSTSRTRASKGGHSGMELERDDAIVYRMRGDKIVRLEYFNDQRRAL